MKKEVEDKPLAELEIRKTKTIVTRTVPCRVADYLIRSDLRVEWRQQHGSPHLKSSDLVFVSPKTDLLIAKRRILRVGRLSGICSLRISPTITPFFPLEVHSLPISCRKGE